MKKEVGLLSVNDNFSLIDVEKWNRREIFFYFSRIAPTTYSVTSNLDITNMIKALKEHNLKFFPSFFWLSTTIINQHPEFRVAMKDGNIGYYHICECTNEECTDKYGNRSIFALMPEPIEYNGNHSIFYTGGRTYLEDNDMQELSNQIFKAIQPSINNYIERKLNPKNKIDENLNLNNIELWTSRDVDEILANWFYEHGMKK